MKKKYKKSFQDLELKYKVLLITSFAGIIPLCLLTIFSLVTIQHFTLRTEHNKNYDNLRSAQQQLNSTLSTYEESLSFLINYDRLKTDISLKNPSNYDQYNLYVYTVVPLFNSIMAQQPSISNITLYTSLDIYNHGDFVKKIVENDITRFFPVNNTTNPGYFYDKEEQIIYLYSQLFSRQSEEKHFIVFELKPNSLFKNLNTISNDPYTLTINDSLGQNIFYTKQQTDSQSTDYLTNLLKFLFKGETVNEEQLKNHWVIHFNRPIASMYRGIFLLVLVALIIVLFSLFAVFLAVRSLTKTVVSPLQVLAEEMRNVDDENFLTHQLNYDSTDEIGQVYQAFNQMLNEMNRLVDEVYQAEINQKKHELRALQAQINPHFFYNSLSLINNKAVMIGNEEISDMAQLLSQFYRLSLNNGKNRLTIQKEMDLTVTYANIQLKMHRNSFDLITEIEEDILHFEIINLLIQPFVENAIFHGIDHIEDNRRGKLSIKGYYLNNQIYFEVSDNGVGMTENQLSNIMSPNNQQHYGIYNVQQRILLYYGSSDAIHYISSPNKGTKVTIILPTLLEKQ